MEEVTPDSQFSREKETNECDGSIVLLLELSFLRSQVIHVRSGKKTVLKKPQVEFEPVISIIIPDHNLGETGGSSTVMKPQRMKFYEQELTKKETLLFNMLGLYVPR